MLNLRPTGVTLCSVGSLGAQAKDPALVTRRARGPCFAGWGHQTRYIIGHTWTTPCISKEGVSLLVLVVCRRCVVELSIVSHGRARAGERLFVGSRMREFARGAWLSFLRVLIRAAVNIDGHNQEEHVYRCCMKLLESRVGQERQATLFRTASLWTSGTTSAKRWVSSLSSSLSASRVLLRLSWACAA